MSSELIFFIISIAFILIGVKLKQKGEHLLLNGKKAEGIIFKNNQNHSARGNGSYYPVVRFLTDKREWITQELSIGYSTPKPEGEKLTLIYDPEDPKIVEIYSSFQLEIIPTILIVAGIGFSIIGALMYLEVF